MKYIILVCDGAADYPIKELGNKTIFEAASTHNLDYIASYGQIGLFKTIPDGMPPGSEAANMAIMGYRPERNLTGRGPLEALSAGVSLKVTDIAFRCNLITIKNGIIIDYSAEHISTPEARILMEELQNNLHRKGVDFFLGFQYRNILRLDGNIYSEEVLTTPPHDIVGENYLQHLPASKDHHHHKSIKTANLLKDLINQSQSLLIKHPINKQRDERKKNLATHIWPWSGGKKPKIIPFIQKYGLEGSVISAVDLIFGLGIAAGLTPIHVEGATGLPDTNYKGKVKAALKELEKKDFAYIHIEGIDEMAHLGDFKRKISALEDFDEFIVGPILKSEKHFNNHLSIAVLPDHYTPCSVKTHTSEPVPFVFYNPIKRSQEELQLRSFSEKNALKGELGLIDNGEEFMNRFLMFHTKNK